MTYDEGRFVSEKEAAARDEQAWREGSLRLLDPEARRRLDLAVQAEQRVLAALLDVAERCGSEERMAFFTGEFRGKETEADRIAREHGFGQARLIAMKSLARQRGVGLEVVLRAALRGDLRSIVELPRVVNRATDQD